VSHVHADRHGRRGALGRRLATVFVAATASTALIAPLAGADTLSNLRADAKANAAQQNAARNAIAQSQENVYSATQRLLDSQAQLDEAQAVLADISVQLDAARENDARIAADLKAAQEELERAKQRVAKAEDDVEAQLALIGSAARESFQQQTDLRGLTVVFGSESPAELSQRLQWNTTIFDTQAAEKSRLDQVLAELEAARQAQAEIEARIAADKLESERNVARIADLERRAELQRNKVADLVAANEQARAAAQGELDAEQANYRTLKAAEQDTQRLIKQEMDRLWAEEQARLKKEAEERAEREEQARIKREQAARAKAEADAAERARAKDAAAKRDKANQAKVESARADAAAKPSRSSSSSTTRATSAWGFVRPVNANYGSAFGQRFHPILKIWRAHNGVDMGARTGTPIYAAQSGTVLQAGVNGGFGQYVLISHGRLVDGKVTTTGYAHQSRIVVRAGQKVQRGQLIGYVGNTGLSTTPHLHFEVRLNGTPVNPVRYVP